MCNRCCSLLRQVWDSAQSFAASLSSLKERPHTKRFQDASSCAQSIWFTLITSGQKKNKRGRGGEQGSGEDRRDAGRLLHHPDKICSDPTCRSQHTAGVLTPPATQSSPAWPLGTPWGMQSTNRDLDALKDPMGPCPLSFAPCSASLFLLL